jgi:hypothetical protein
MKISYLPQLTDEETEEYNADEYMTIYSSIPRNMKVYEDWLNQCWPVFFCITPILPASIDGEPAKQVIQ